MPYILGLVVEIWYHFVFSYACLVSEESLMISELTSQVILLIKVIIFFFFFKQKQVYKWLLFVVAACQERAAWLR